MKICSTDLRWDGVDQVVLCSNVTVKRLNGDSTAAVCAFTMLIADLQRIQHAM